MSGRVLQFPRGSVIEFSSGEYSDYRMDALVVAIADLDLPTLAAECRAEHKPKDEWDKCQPDSFASWLIAKGHALPVACTEVHAGSYGSWDTELGGDE